MKQFLKQLGVGILLVLVLIVGVMVLRWLSTIVLKATNWNIEDISQNIYWIALGMIFAILIQALGILVLKLFGSNAKAKNRVARKKSSGFKSKRRYDADEEDTAEGYEYEVVCKSQQDEYSTENDDSH